MRRLVIAKYGGSALGPDGRCLPQIIERLRQFAAETKVVAVVSAPLTSYDGKPTSLTDVALKIGNAFSVADAGDVDVLMAPYRRIAEAQMVGEHRREFLATVEAHFAKVVAALRQAAEYRQFYGATRARVLAYSGELSMACALDAALNSQGIDSARVDIERWPIITDDNLEAAQFLPVESRLSTAPLLELINNHQVVCIGGFVGKTVDGQETTFERGGSDRTAVDLAVLLRDHFDVDVSFEKDSIVYSGDPKVVPGGVEPLHFLSYGEAKLAGTFGMKILDPMAIRDLEDVDADIPLWITDLAEPKERTLIRQQCPGLIHQPVKIVTGKRNCAIVRMDHMAALHLAVALGAEKRFNEFIHLSQFSPRGRQQARLLFLDGSFVRRHESYIRAYDRRVEIVYQRGVITLVGDEMHRAPHVVALASAALGENDIRILDLDAQEETSRVLIVIDAAADSVARAVRAIHQKRAEMNAAVAPRRAS